MPDWLRDVIAFALWITMGMVMAEIFCKLI